MKAFAIQNQFGLDALKPITLPDPRLGRDKFWCAFAPRRSITAIG